MIGEWMHTLDIAFQKASALVWGWPLIIFIGVSAVIMTYALNFVQFTYFTRSWKYLFTPEKKPDVKTVKDDDYISPFQAFLNVLNTSLGNGSLAGMATAMYSGGPGAAFWVFILGFFTMVIRFAEVYAATAFVGKDAHGSVRGGPMYYLQKVPGGAFLSPLYALFCLGLAFASGNASQCNSIRLSLEKMTGISPYWVAVLLLLFLFYVLFGGAKRIIKVSQAIVPVKVIVFFGSTIAVLAYNYAAIIPAIKLIVQCAFSAKALAGGMIGYSVQNAIRYGFSRTLNATEAGLGNAGIMYGATGVCSPGRSAVMSMASTFISTHLVCLALMVLFVVTGTWSSGLTSTALTIAAYETLFGAFGGWIVTFLSIAFGMGVLVGYAFIGRECWSFLFKGKYQGGFMFLYCLVAVIGTLGSVSLVWNAVDLVNAGLIITNVYGLLYLLPSMKKGFTACKLKLK